MAASMASSTSTYSITLHKVEKKTKVGVLFKNDNEGVRVAEISPDGLALQSDLSVGDKILSINGNEVSELSAKQAARILRKSSGRVEIVAETRDDTTSVQVTSVESTPLLVTASNIQTLNTSALLKKSWTWQDSLQDHCRILVNLPMMIFAPLVLTPQASETIQLSVNSVNNCKICANLHGELARMAGIVDNKSILDEESQELDLFADFGHTFGKYNGYGSEVTEKYDKIVAEKGGLVGLSAEAQGFLILWGSLVGNTISSFFEGTLKSNTKQGSNAIFELLFVAYYGPFFLVLNIFSFLLKALPSNLPNGLNRIFGLIIAAVVACWALPYAALGILTLPFVTGTRSIMASSVGGYLP